MNINEIAAGIQIIGNNVTKLVVENTLANYAEAKEKKIDFYIIPPKAEKDDEGEYVLIGVGFNIDISSSESQRFHMEFEIEGAFASNDEIDDSEFAKLVMINGATALVGIARGKIESISGNMLNSGKIVIPFINVMDYYNEMNNK